MSTCRHCGEEIEFRYVDGILKPIHVSGGYCSGYAYRDSGSSGSSYSYHSSMKGLAEELGQSLLFPTDCRHCGDPILLFANPDGGFAIFNAPPGKPWPKHFCELISPKAQDYHSPNTSVSLHQRFPIRSGTVERAPRDGDTLRGVVIAVKRNQIQIYNGANLYWVTSSIPVLVGNSIVGTVSFSQGKLILQLTVILPPSRNDIAASEKAALRDEGEVIDVGKNNEYITALARSSGKRIKNVWAVMSERDRCLATFEHSKKGEACALAERMTANKRGAFYVTSLKLLMK